MSAIDQVIARARQGDVGFSERKQFKLARRRAIEKLRRFALADPYFYVLEIIQGAIAGGADYVDIACSEGDVLISWTGGSIKPDELAQLFAATKYQAEEFTPWCSPTSSVVLANLGETYRWQDVHAALWDEL